MIDRFLDYISVEKRYSTHTLISYKKDLEDFLLFLMKTEGGEDFTLVTKKVVRNFMVSLSEKQMSKRSINRKLSTLRSFYLFLLKTGDVKVSPLDSVESLKFYPEKQMPFSQEEMIDLKKQIEVHDIPFLNRLIIETLYQTGMRKAELCNLELKGVDFSKSELKVQGKGNKTRMIPISEELKAEYQIYLSTRNPSEGFGDYFFLNEKGRKLNERFVYKVVNQALGMVTSKKKKSPHILRHSFATHVLDNGAEISKVKALLGHSSLASTQVYTSANIAQLKKVFNQAHPRARKKEE